MGKRTDWNKIAAQGVGIFLLLIFFIVLWHDVFGETMFKPGNATSLRGRKLPIGAPPDGYMPKFDAANDTFYWAPDLTGEGGTGIFSEDSLTAHGYYYNPTSGDFEFNIAGAAFRVKFIDSCIYLDTHVVACVNNLGQLEIGAPGIAEFDSLLALGNMKFVSSDSLDTVYVNWARMDSMIDLTGRYAAGAGSFSLATFMAYVASGYFDTTTAATDPDDKLYVKLADAATADGAGHTIATYFSPTTHNHDATYATISHNHAATDITSGTLSTDRYSAYADLTAEAKLGTASDQVAIGNHNHDGTYSLLGHTHTGYILDAYDDLNSDGDIGTGAAQVAAGNHNHSSTYQPLEATLTDIADGTIAENLVNTANPWAANEITEADPTLTNDATVTVGSGSENVTITFNSGASVDGTIAWNNAAGRFSFNGNTTYLGSGSGTSVGLYSDVSGTDGSITYNGTTTTHIFSHDVSITGDLTAVDSAHTRVVQSSGLRLPSGFLKIGSDSITDITGTNLSVTDGVLNAGAAADDIGDDSANFLHSTRIDTGVAIVLTADGITELDSLETNYVRADDSLIFGDQKLFGDTSVLSETEKAGRAWDTLQLVLDDTTNFKKAYDSVFTDTGRTTEGELEDSLDNYFTKTGVDSVIVDSLNKYFDTALVVDTILAIAALTDNFSELGGTVGDAQIADGAVDGGTGGEIADGSIVPSDVDKTKKWQFTGLYVADSTKEDSAAATKAYVDYKSSGAELVTVGELNLTGQLYLTNIINQLDTVGGIFCKHSDSALQLDCDEVTITSACDSAKKTGGIHPDVVYWPSGYGPQYGDTLTYDFIGDPWQLVGYEPKWENAVTSGGTYSGGGIDTFYIKITDEGTPDSVCWIKGDTSDWSGADTVLITGSAQSMSDGVTFTFAATTGHVDDDVWVIYAYDVQYVVDAGSPQWEYWMAYSYSDSCEDLALEETILNASHDGYNWELPYALVNSGDTLWAPSPIIAADSVIPRWVSYVVEAAEYYVWLNDPEIVIGPDLNMHFYTNAFVDADTTLVATASINHTISIESSNGVFIFPTGECTYNVVDSIDIFDSDYDAYLSPAVIIDTGGLYSLYSVVKYESGGNTVVMRKQSSYPDSAFGTADTCVITGLPTGYIPWHVNVTKLENMYDMFIVSCTLGTSGGGGNGAHGLYLGRSTDGVNFTVCSDPILSSKEAVPSWDSMFIYRAAAVWGNFGGFNGYRLWYSARHAGGGGPGNGDWYQIGVADIMNGRMEQALGKKTRSFVIANPATTHDFPFWQTPRKIKIVGISAIASGGTNVIGQLQEYSGTATSAADVDASDWTVTTSEYTDVTFSNGIIDAGDWIGWKTTSVSGSVSFLSVTVDYYEY